LLLDKKKEKEGSRFKWVQGLKVQMGSKFKKV
jgi:hypothetical protein